MNFRFTEDDAAAMLNLIDLALVQQQALPPLPESGTAAAMDIEQQDIEQQGHPQNPDATATSELEALRQQQQELQEEARQLELRQQQVQQEAAQTAGWLQDDQRIGSSGREPDSKQEGAAPADGNAECPSSVDLFAPANESRRPSMDGAGSAVEIPRETKPRGKPGRTVTAKRRAPSRRKRVLDD